MSTTAPNVRLIDQFGGSLSKFIEANATADERIREFDRLARDNHMLKLQNEGLLARLDELTEGGSLEQQVRELGRDLISTRAENERLRAELESYRAAVSS